MALGIGTIVAIVVGAILVVGGCIAFGVIFTIRRRRERKGHVAVLSRGINLEFEVEDVDEDIRQPNMSMIQHTKHRSSNSDSSMKPLMQGYSEVPSTSVTHYPSLPYPSYPTEYLLAPQAVNTTTASQSPSFTPSNQVDPSSSVIPQPSFVPIPRTSSPPVRRAGSRSARDMRTTVLTRVATKTQKTLDGNESDSPTSVYSQSSAGTSMYRDVGINRNSSAIPPVPALPSPYRNQSHLFRASISEISESDTSDLNVSEWRTEAVERIIADLGNHSESPRDSIAFPIPSVQDLVSNQNSNWWAGALATISPTGAHAAQLASSPADNSVSLTAAISGFHKAPEIVESPVDLADNGRRGSVGYQLPPNLRVGDAEPKLPYPRRLTSEHNGLVYTKSV